MPGTYPIHIQGPTPPGLGLGRHVNHDPRSRRFPYRATRDTIAAVRHERAVPIFDQGELGSCVGNAALGILGTGPYWTHLTIGQQATGPGPGLTWNEQGAVELYSMVTAADPYDGTWPPEDTGSDGLSAAKVLTTLGIIPGYRHTFTFPDALTALMDAPLLVGTLWTGSMFYPDRSGIVSVGPIAGAVGGHEYIIDEFNPRLDAVGCTTSWGDSFGKGGRFYIRLNDFERLLDADGDVVVLALPTGQQPTPEPAPADTDPDAALIAAFTAWRQARGLN